MVNHELCLALLQLARGMVRHLSVQLTLEIGPSYRSLAVGMQELICEEDMSEHEGRAM